MDQAASLLGEPDHAVLIDTGHSRTSRCRCRKGILLLVVDSGIEHAHEAGDYALRRAELERGDGGARSAADHVDAELNEARASRRWRRLRQRLGERARRRDLGAARRRRCSAPGTTACATTFEVSTPELDLLVDLAYEHGALAARMTGGGFGGSIVALVDRDDAATITDAVVERVPRTHRDRRSRAGHARCGGAREIV